jgi:tRNA(Arg) A34 adenosine deaminase TadA
MKNGGRNIAVAFNNVQVLGIGVDTTWRLFDPATATVNLLQNAYHELRRDSFSIATTSQPTEACLGMARILGAQKLFCFIDGVHRMYLPQSPPPWLPQAPPGNGNDVDVPPMPPTFGNPGTQEITAEAWYDALGSIDPIPRNFVAYADHLIIHRNVTLPAQIGVLPPLDVALSTALNEQRRKILMLAAQAMVAAVGFRDRKNMVRIGGNTVGHNIGCIIVSKMGEIIEWGLNRSNENPSLHAETYAIMHWLHAHGRDPLPSGVEMFTTLMSCHMCAGVIAGAGDGVCVHYAQNDPLMQENSLKRGINRSTEKKFNFARGGVTNFPGQFRIMIGDARLTEGLNSTAGFALMAEAVHAYKRMRYMIDRDDDLTVYKQAAGLINSITPNLV